MKKNSTSTEKFDLYQVVTDRIIAEMEKGIIPWQKPWGGCLEGAISYTSRKPYSFLNQMLLGEPGEYLTFNQITALGGRVKKGAKQRMVVFYKPFKVKDKVKNPETGEIEEKDDVAFVLRYYNVFHLKDTEGIESKIQNVPAEIEPIELAESVARDYVEREDGLKLTFRAGDKAYYSPSLDEVVVPLLSQYQVAEEYYSTLFHELTHSTGSEKRLKRTNGMASFFGSSDYSKEELVAEMGAAMTLNRLGIDCEKAFKNSVAYLQNWIQVLKNDRKFIISASSQAQKAVDYIFGEMPAETINA